MKKLLTCAALAASFVCNGFSAESAGSAEQASKRYYEWTPWRADAFIARYPDNQEIQALKGKDVQEVYEYYSNNMPRTGEVKPVDWMMPYNELPPELITGVSKDDWNAINGDDRLRNYWARIFWPRPWTDNSNTHINILTLTKRLEEKDFPLTSTEWSLTNNIVKGIGENRVLYDRSIKYVKLRIEGKTENAPEVKALGINPKRGCLYVNDFPARVDNLEWTVGQAQKPDFSWIYECEGTNSYGDPWETCGRDTEHEMYQLWYARNAGELVNLQAENERLQDEIQGLRNDLQQQKGAYEAKIAEQSEQLTGLKASYDASLQKLEELTNRVSSQDQPLTELQAENKRLNDEIQGLENNLQNLQQQFDQRLNDVLADHQKQIEDLQAQMAQKKDKSEKGKDKKDKQVKEQETSKQSGTENTESTEKRPHHHKHTGSSKAQKSGSSSHGSSKDQNATEEKTVQSEKPEPSERDFGN